MPGYYKKASALPISVTQRAILEELVRRHTSQQHHVKRASIILHQQSGEKHNGGDRASECPPRDSLYLAQALACSPRTPRID